MTMPVNHLLTSPNKPKHALRVDRLSVNPISSLSQGSKTNPTTIVTYSHMIKSRRITRFTISNPK